MNLLTNKLLLLADAIEKGGLSADAARLRDILLKKADMAKEELVPMEQADEEVVPDSELAQLGIDSAPAETDEPMEYEEDRTVDNTSDGDLPEQVDFRGSVSENFDMCPSAVRLLMFMIERYENSGSPNNLIEDGIRNTMKSIDDLLSIKRQVLESATDPSEQVASMQSMEQAQALARETTVNAVLVGTQLGEDVVPLTDMLSFLDTHVNYISERVPKA